MDRLQAMRTFVRVAELGSFSAVARQLGVARSVVTRQIASLERELGTRLIARSTRRLALTPPGSAYLEKCRAILEMLDLAESELARERGGAEGRIRLSVPLSFGLARLAPLLIDFAAEHAQVMLEIDFTDRRVDLLAEGFDLAVRVTSRLAPDDVVRRLAVQQMVTIASPAYLARAGRPAHPRELFAHDCLSYSGDASRHAWSFSVGGRTEAFPVRARLCASNGEALAEAAARGLGIARLPDFIVEPCRRDGRVEVLLSRFAPPPLGVYAVLPSARHLPHRVRLLVDFLAGRLASPAPAGSAKASRTKASRTKPARADVRS